MIQHFHQISAAGGKGMCHPTSSKHPLHFSTSEFTIAIAIESVGWKEMQTLVKMNESLE